jgi:hypothetical protein
MQQKFRQQIATESDAQTPEAPFRRMASRDQNGRRNTRKRPLHEAGALGKGVQAQLGKTDRPGSQPTSLTQALFRMSGSHDQGGRAGCVFFRTHAGYLPILQFRRPSAIPNWLGRRSIA